MLKTYLLLKFSIKDHKPLGKLHRLLRVKRMEANYDM